MLLYPIIRADAGQCTGCNAVLQYRKRQLNSETVTAITDLFKQTSNRENILKIKAPIQTNEEVSAPTHLLSTNAKTVPVFKFKC